MIFLWLPTPSTFVKVKAAPQRIKVGRLRVWVEGGEITHVGHVPEGLGKMKLASEWEQMPRGKRPRGLTQGLSSQVHIPPSVDWYLRFDEGARDLDRWEYLVELAIAQWREKMKLSATGSRKVDETGGE